MKRKILFGCWICLYALCAGLSHVPSPRGFQSVALTILSVLFFLPGAVLLAEALRSQDTKTLRLLRLISGASLGLTLVMLVVNVCSVLASELLGTVLYEILLFVSVPMVCSRHWVLSLFLWACLLFATFVGRTKK